MGDMYCTYTLKHTHTAGGRKGMDWGIKATCQGLRPDWKTGTELDLVTNS